MGHGLHRKKIEWRLETMDIRLELLAGKNADNFQQNTTT